MGIGPIEWPPNVRTFSIDIGGSGIKGSVLDAHGEMVVERVRVDTPYPCPPQRLVETICALAKDLPQTERASVGFPGMVRNGRVLAVPSLSRPSYDGQHDPTLAALWNGFDLGKALSDELTVPTKVVNDADMQGCAVVSGHGMEFVLTLGTGVGTALFNDGSLLPHLELSHGPFRDGLSFDIALGNSERKAIGKIAWRSRVQLAINDFDSMFFFDRLYVGGGNAKHLEVADIGPKGEVVPNIAGITGGVRIWELEG